MRTGHILRLTIAAFLLAVRPSADRCCADESPQQTQPPSAAAADGAELRIAGSDTAWWNDRALECLLSEPEWVSFDLHTIVTDALINSPRIGIVKRRTAVALERIVQEEAAFDPNMLLDSRYGRTSDPVGNALVTGGPSRLVEESWNNRFGVTRTGRDGTRVDLSQQSGLLDSNSLFFEPNHQGNTRLNLSLTRPLRAGSGRLYNERLVLQARLDSQTTWQEMLREVQAQVAGVMTGFWRLYEARCHLLQRRDALERGLEITALIEARQSLDTGGLELAKVQSRVARRRDAVIESERNVIDQQILLTQLIGSPSLPQGMSLELIPNGMPVCVPIELERREAILTGINHRYEIRSAAVDLESAALAISISRNELLPQLDAVVSGYLAGLNGRNDMWQSFTDQFARTPGFNGGIVYERPYGNRAARSRMRSARQRYLESADRYREIVSITTAEVELAVRQLNTISRQLDTKREMLDAVSRQEMMVRRRWETLGTDGRYAALVLEDLLEQQEARTAAEIELASAEVGYLLALIELQRAMGTLLMAEGIEPMGTGAGGDVRFPMQGPAAPPVDPQQHDHDGRQPPEAETLLQTSAVSEPAGNAPPPPRRAVRLGGGIVQ